MLELLQQPKTGSLNKKQKEYLEKIYIANERMIALLNDLLEVSRIDEKDFKIYAQPTDLIDLISSALEDKEREIKNKNLKINFNFDPRPFPFVKTERNKIKQTFGNLLTNAINYTPEGGTINIDLKVKAQFAVCSIADTGVGVPEAERKHLFKKFFRAKNVQGFEVVGTGLGLYICKSFVEASGGKLSYKPNTDHGSIFYFTLPVVK